MNNDTTRLRAIFSIAVLFLAFTAMIAVLAIDLVMAPGRMIPNIVTGIIFAVVGYAIHELGGTNPFQPPTTGGT